MPEEYSEWEDPLYLELAATGSDLLTEAGDYGYGGEYITRVVLDATVTKEFIEARERRLLGGQTLAEYIADEVQ